jgi:hypothetical protein
LAVSPLSITAPVCVCVRERVCARTCVCVCVSVCVCVCAAAVVVKVQHAQAPTACHAHAGSKHTMTCACTHVHSHARPRTRHRARARTCAVKHGIGHVCHLRARRHRIVNHALHHLRRANDELAADLCVCVRVCACVCVWHTQQAQQWGEQLSRPRAAVVVVPRGRACTAPTPGVNTVLGDPPGAPPAHTWQRLIIIFCASATFSGGISCRRAHTRASGGGQQQQHMCTRGQPVERQQQHQARRRDCRKQPHSARHPGAGHHTACSETRRTPSPPLPHTHKRCAGSVGARTMARSPRATMMPSASARMSSKLMSPACDSILQMICDVRSVRVGVCVWLCWCVGVLVCWCVAWQQVPAVAATYALHMYACSVCVASRCRARAPSTHLDVGRTRVAQHLADVPARACVFGGRP